MLITEFPPNLPNEQMSGGRVQSISVHPTKVGHIFIATQFCGLWKTENGGLTWFHIDSLPSIFVRDVAYAPDGKTVIATLERDNHVKNGGGIWVSPEEGRFWYRPTSGDPHNHPKLPNKSRIPKRISAYGICYSPDDPKKVYVGTDYGVAISLDNGNTWHHTMLEDSSPLWSDFVHHQNSVLSILALPNNRVIALSRTGIYRTNDKFKAGRTWTWNLVQGGNFAWWGGFKNIDVSPLDNDKVFIFEHPGNLVLYEVTTGVRTNIPLLMKSFSRGPFVRVSKSTASSSSIDIWIGLGRLYKATCKDLDSVKKLNSKDWTGIGGDEGVHDDTGYLGLDNNKMPILYGSDGGLFKPTNAEATKWKRVTVDTGFNSFLIQDVAGTNVRSPKHTCLYFGTQDNYVWASGDGGKTWENNDGGEGFHIQVMKDAISDSEVRVAYYQIGGSASSNCRFSDAHLVKQKNVPDLDTDGGTLSDMAEAFFISPNKWIRLGKSETANPEVYISQDDGEKWRKIANIDLSCQGVFTVSKWVPYVSVDPFDDSKPGARGPIVYVPFRGYRTRPDGNEIIGLIRLTDIFGTTVKNYNEMDLIYLKDNGSLGRRYTDWVKPDGGAVFGVDPKNPHFIIAPDIYNNRVMVSRDSGLNWSTDHELTRAVTKNKSLMLYDENPRRMQVTCISFDPYHRDHIYVGTRDAGIILSTDGGTTWKSIPGTDRILYVTSFFFGPRSDTIIVSSYGRGLWKIYTRIIILVFPFDDYCRRGDCRIRLPFDPKPPIYERIDWRDKDVIIFMNGHVNGLSISQNVLSISMTPGSVTKRYVGKTEVLTELNIFESEKRQGFSGMKGCLAAIKNGEKIKGLILKEGKIFGIISGKEDFKEEEKVIKANTFNSKKDLTEHKNDLDYKSKDKADSIDSQKPYLFISTSIPIMGTSVVGNDGVINLFAKGFKFVSKGNNNVKIMIDSQVVNKSAKVLQNGNIRSQLKISQDISFGEHVVKIVQKLNGKILTATERFTKIVIDEGEENENKMQKS